MKAAEEAGLRELSEPVHSKEAYDILSPKSSSSVTLFYCKGPGRAAGACPPPQHAVLSLNMFSLCDRQAETLSSSQTETFQNPQKMWLG